MEKRDFSGILSRNDRKTEPTHADYNGSCMVDGTEYYLNGWINQRKDGSGSFLSLRFKLKGKPEGQTQAPVNRPAEDDLPF